MQWNGPIKTAVRSFASPINYQVKTVGAEPGDSVLMNINTDRSSIYDLVQDIGLQTGNSAGVILNPANKAMTIVWGPETKSVDGLTVGTSW